MKGGGSQYRRWPKSLTDLKECSKCFGLFLGLLLLSISSGTCSGVILSENLTVEGINRIFIEAKHASSLNRFLTAGIWKQEELNDARINMLKAQEALGGKRWLAIDDTLAHKTGKKIEGVGIFWDHSEKRYVLVHNIVTAEYVNPRGQSHPLDFRLYLKKDQAQKESVSFKTKIVLAKELVEDALRRGLEIQGALFDNWFASK